MTTAVLVTGGAGYIGSHVCKALAEAGLQPVFFDTLEKGHGWAVRLGPLERADISAAALRYFNAAGADADGAIGEAHHPEPHLLPLAADAALGLGPALTLLGTDYRTPDGSCIRDFVHVSDLADAHLRALDWLRSAPEGGLHEAFNLGSGAGYSVRQVIAETARIAGRAVPHTIGPRRPGDSPKLVGDIAKARHELGWTPKRDLAVQIEDTLRWRRKMPR